MSRALQRSAADLPARSGPGRFVDQLLQIFEDRRPGLGDATLAQGEAATLEFFLQIVAQEEERLAAMVADWQPQLSPAGREKLRVEIDKLLRDVVVPAYVRLARSFTPRERRDFFLVPDSLKLLERLGWGALGLIAGYLVILAPFIPIWSKEWVVVAVIGGLLWPEIRRWFSFRRYERDLNLLVDRSERELVRLDQAYLERGEVIDELKNLGKES
jgi:hypothetical protein